MTQINKLTDWDNIDLKSPSQSSLNILDSYSFDILLLEISCNIKDIEINEKTVREQAMISINAKYNEAINVLDANLKNITKEAVEYSNL